MNKMIEQTKKGTQRVSQVDLASVYGAERALQVHGDQDTETGAFVQVRVNMFAARDGNLTRAVAAGTD